MDPSNRAGGSSNWSSLKYFYENFVNELSDGDFSDCECKEEHVFDDSEDELKAAETVEYISQEEFDAANWQTMGPEVVWVQEAPVVIVLDDELDDVLETAKNTPRQRKNQANKVSATPKRLKSSNVLNTRKTTSQNIEPVRPKPARVTNFKFKCDRCNKGSNKPDFLDKHTIVQCERAQSSASRQNSIKKTFSF